MMGVLVVGAGTVAEYGLLGRKVDDENQVRALGDDDFVRMINVQQAGGWRLEEVMFFRKGDEISVPLGEPRVFEFRVI